MLITDGRKVVEIEIRTIEDDYTRGQDITQDLIIDDGYTHNRLVVADIWIIDDVDYCISQVKDMMDGKGDWTDEGPILDAELTINPITQKTDDFSAHQLITIIQLAREKSFKVESYEAMEQYVEIAEIAESILLGN